MLGSMARSESVAVTAEALLGVRRTEVSATNTSVQSASIARQAATETSGDQAERSESLLLGMLVTIPRRQGAADSPDRGIAQRHTRPEVEF